MGLFEELCAKLNAKRERDINYVSLARSMARAFAESFKQCVNAPNWYKITDEKNREQSLRYIDVAPSDEAGDDIVHGQWTDADMLFDHDGFFLFSLIVTLEYAPEAYPKQRFKIPCGVRPIDRDGCDIFIGMRDDKTFFREFSWKKKVPQQNDGPEQYAYSVLVEYLDSAPYERNSKVKGIGFL